MDVNRTGIPSNRTWSKVGYSRAIRVGNLIEVAGTSSSGPDGQILHPGDMYKQAKEVSAIYGISALLHPDLLIEVEATAIVGDHL